MYLHDHALKCFQPTQLLAVETLEKKNFFIGVITLYDWLCNVCTFWLILAALLFI